MNDGSSPSSSTSTIYGKNEEKEEVDDGDELVVITTDII